MALERLTLAPAPVGGGGGDDGSRPPRLPRWTRQEILVLIQGKRVAENRVRRVRAVGPDFRSCQVEPKWASVSSYCKRHGVNRGPVQCRKRWSNLAGDYKKIKEWELQIREETESFWVMRNDLRRERKLPGFFDREVYDILDGGGSSSAEDPTALALALALAPATEEGELEGELGPDAVFDSGRSAAADDGLFSDFEEVPRSPSKKMEPPTTHLPSPIPISETQCQPLSQRSPSQASGTREEKDPTPSPDTLSGQKRKQFPIDADEDLSLQGKLLEAMERNGRLLSSQLEAQNTNFQLDREQRTDHVISLIAVLNKLADAMGRIADKL